MNIVGFGRSELFFKIGELFAFLKRPPNFTYWDELDFFEYINGDLIILGLQEEIETKRLDEVFEKTKQIPKIAFLPANKTEQIRKLLLLGCLDIFIDSNPIDLLHDQISSFVKNCLFNHSEVGTNKNLAPLADSKFIFPNNGYGKHLQELFTVAINCYDSVLIQGETGTGKDILAREIHRYSNLRDEPLVAFNCASVPSELLSAELFGSVRGAFTGSQDRIGVVEAARCGTLFLDELGELPKDAQVKLLRLLENREVQPLGSNEIRKVNARIIVAASQPLEELKNRVFRKDLYYRINTLVIKLPPLRYQLESIPLFVDNFIKEYNCDKIFSALAIEKLLNYNWPGNVRQLRNVLRKAMLLSKGKMVLPEEIDFS